MTQYGWYDENTEGSIGPFDSKEEVMTQKII